MICESRMNISALCFPEKRRQMYAHLKGRLSPDGKTYLFLDKVQEIKGWEKVVNSLISDFDVDLYVTGSNSRMMSSEISTTHLQKYSQDEIYTIVRDIYNSPLFSDIVKRNQVRKIDQLECVVKYTFQNSGIWISQETDERRDSTWQHGYSLELSSPA